MTPEEVLELLTFDRDREIFCSALSHIGFALVCDGDDTFTLKLHYTVDELLHIMRFLRSDEGCPWDREQTHESIAGNMLEEAYEVVDAIMSGNKEDLCEELGDVLMQVVFHASMAEDEGLFDFDDVVSGICRKLISRHSHLFGDDQAKTPEEVLSIWNKNKDREKGFSSVRESMEAVSRALPALTRSLKLQKRAARVGFDWPDATGALNKIKEEYGELLDALAICRSIDASRADRQVEVAGILSTSKNPSDDSDISQSLYSAKREAVEEAGDLLFAVVNALRLSGIDPETALTMSSEKFIRRFSEVERLALSDGRKLESMTLEEMDMLWKKTKAEE
ncbi:MAG: nucleoside triphosphate pyrophosphohydrolase [Clostridiaceae bacterium]|nr:nucleoside triphosphate pyrophosphohydrolase [Clostridiaceae bacterium]